VTAAHGDEGAPVNGVTAGENPVTAGDNPR
jgi:hypothetical protein